MAGDEMTAAIKYVLCRVVEGNTARLEITQQEYISLQTADKQLSHALDVEDKYDVTIIWNSKLQLLKKLSTI
jgi:hypothetical protein